MRPSVECVGTVRIPLSPEEALRLLTPEGERAWVEGWAPSYPTGAARDPERGLVFIVGKETGASVWIVTRFEPDRGAASYAYVLPGRRAVLIDVDVAAEVDDRGEVNGRREESRSRSTATIVYRMTSLESEGDAFVRDFQDGYEAYLRGWESDIGRLLSAQGGP